MTIFWHSWSFLGHHSDTGFDWACFSQQTKPGKLRLMKTTRLSQRQLQSIKGIRLSGNRMTTWRRKKGLVENHEQVENVPGHSAHDPLCTLITAQSLARARLYWCTTFGRMQKKYPAVFINALEEACLGAIYSTPSSTLKSTLRICPLVQAKPSPGYNWVASFPANSYEEEQHSKTSEEQLFPKKLTIFYNIQRTCRRNQN